MNKRQIVTLTNAACIALLTACAGPQVTRAPAVPESLQPPASETLALETHANGAQIYQCKPGKDDPARFEWAFKAPEAELFDTSGKHVGKHYGGPSWELQDGSKVVGEVRAKADAPDAQAIPWLLLHAKETSGAGTFSRTLSIQRVATVGGKAPSAGCDQARQGEEVRVPYQATYYFYQPKS